MLKESGGSVGVKSRRSQWNITKNPAEPNILGPWGVNETELPIRQHEYDGPMPSAHMYSYVTGFSYGTPKAGA